MYLASNLPPPYESAPDDDLGAATAAALAGSVGLLIAISLGLQVQRQYEDAFDAVDGGALSGRGLETVVTTAGWGIAALFLAVGAVLLVFRRGRGALLLGAVVGIVVTAVARYQYHWFTPVHPLPNVVVYFGGVVVLVLALLPATRRWIAGRGRRSGTLPPVTTATPLRPSQAQIGPTR